MGPTCWSRIYGLHLKVMSRIQSTKFVFTHNNYTDDDLAVYRSDPPVDGIKWIGFEEEVGVEGTPHIQGALVTYKKRSYSGLHALCPPLKKAHVESMKGRVEDSVVYCSKDDGFEEYGTRPMSSAAKGECNVKRYDEARLAAKEGRYDDIPSDIYVRHYGALHKIGVESRIEPASRDKLENFWIYGPSGCGKSSAALQKYGTRAYLKKADNKWFDGYDPIRHDVLVLEDIAPQHAYQMTNLKIWSDHRAFPAETKGGTLLIRPAVVVVTSNHSIADVFSDLKVALPVDVLAIQRRFTVIDMYTETVTKAPVLRSVVKTKKILAFMDGELSPYDDEPTRLFSWATESAKPDSPKYYTRYPEFKTGPSFAKMDAFVAGEVASWERPQTTPEKLHDYVSLQYKKI